MIKVNTWEDGRDHYLAPATIRRVSDTSREEQYVGKHARVVTDEGTMLVRQKAVEIVAQINGPSAEVREAAEAMRLVLQDDAEWRHRPGARALTQTLVDHVLGGKA